MNPHQVAIKGMLPHHSAGLGGKAMSPEQQNTSQMRLTVSAQIKN